MMVVSASRRSASRIITERSLMPRPSSSSSLRWVVAVTLLVLAAAPSRAQFITNESATRFEITPFAGYQWGGSFSTGATSTIPAGKLEQQSAFSWGGIISFIPQPLSAVELTYLRQQADVHFRAAGQGTRNVGQLTNNYILIGGRREFPTPGGLRPFISAGLGVNILDPNVGDLGDSWRFAWSLGAGAKFMLPNRRVGLRVDVRWMVTPVPSGTYATWCNFWGCAVAQGTSWLNQGHVGGGVVFAF
jgi:opacity protein-like surface antigen